MNRNSGEQPQSESQAGQNLPRVSLAFMLLSGLLLIALLFIPSDGQWWLPAASDREKMFALVFAGMVLADNLLKNHDIESIDKEFSTLAIALMAWVTFFIVTLNDADGSLGSSVFTLLAVFPVLVAVLGPRMSRLMQLGWQISALVLGAGMYLGAFLAAAMQPVSGENGGIFWQVIIGVIGISGASIAVGVAVVVASQRLRDGWAALSGLFKGKK